MLHWILLPGMILTMIPASRGIIHYFQLESYQFPGYFRTLGRNRRHSFLPGICAFLLQAALFGLLYLLKPEQAGNVRSILLCAAYLALSLLGGMGIAKIFTVRNAKKKFVYTGRVKRLFVVYLLVLLLIGFLVLKNTFSQVLLFLPLLLPLVLALAGLLAWPIEKAISECYFRDARRKLLADPQLLRIGITGSYGKTSVKVILGSILNVKWPTLITPASFNTPMGVTRTIREKLQPSHRIFVAEMGARHVGDIKELCRLVKPEIGIITSVGPQHLETFHSIENVTSTKYELIQALPENGTAYFYDDSGICRELYRKTTVRKRLCAVNDPSADCWCDNIHISNSGVSFRLHIRDAGETDCHTVLLGEHALHNILLASAVASDLGMSLRQISHAIARLEPVANRLQLMNTAAGYTIINDAFNANPVGAKAAMEVLSAFPQRRIVITPGMVELGKNEAEYNREFGRQIARSADIAIIIGKDRAKPIMEGILQEGFPAECLYRVDSLQDSTSLLSGMVRSGDTVLYENDLPDHYQEA